MAARFIRRAQAPLLLLVIPALLAACSEHDAPDDDLDAVRAPEVARIVSAREALAGAHLPALDPATMNDAEIRKVLRDGPRCHFRYTSSGKPVVAINLQPDGAAVAAVIKLNGQLVSLEPAADGRVINGANPLLVLADSVRISVKPGQREHPAGRSGASRREADMVFEVGQQLRVGYRGYLDCTPQLPPGAPRS